MVTSTFEELTRGEPTDVVDVDADTLAVLIFTSGTAGSPRAAMLSHGNLLANLAQAKAAGTGINDRRRRLRRASDVPHLRTQRRARRRAC